MPQIFVSCPFSEQPITGFRSVFEDVENELNDERDEDDQVQFIFADEWVGRRDLLEHVKSAIHDAEGAVIDLTRLNLNVLIELGLALAAEDDGESSLLEVMLIERDGHNLRADLPAMLQGAHIQPYKSKNDLKSLLIALIENIDNYE